MDITRSNLPPSLKETAVLRGLLAVKQKELASHKKSMRKAEEALRKEDKLLVHYRSAKVAIEAEIRKYVGHRDGLLKSFVDSESKRAKQWPGYVEPTETGAAGAEWLKVLNEGFQASKSRAEAEIQETNNWVKRLQPLLDDANQELRCQQYSREVADRSVSTLRTVVLDIEGTIAYIRGGFRAAKRVPMEIWAEIFTFHIQSGGQPYPPNHSHTIFLPALAISHVCHLWREVTLHIPALWTDLFWFRVGEKPAQKDLVKLCFERCLPRSPVVHQISKGRLWQTLLHPFPTDSPHDQSRISFSLQSASSRGDMLGVPAELTGRYMQFQPGKILCEGQHLKGTPLGAKFFKRFTQVHTLCIEKATSLNGLVLPGSIEHLEISFSDYNDGKDEDALIRVLHSNLKSLSIRYPRWDHVPNWNRAISLESLHTLCVTPLEHYLLSLLSLPSLQHLTIRPSRTSKIPPPSWLESLDRVCKALVTLTVVGRDEESFRLRKYDIVAIVSRIYNGARQLCQVTISNAKISGRGLRKLLQEGDSLSQRRVLQSLTLKDCVGISRSKCEKLAKLVDNLHVHDTFHSDSIPVVRLPRAHTPTMEIMTFGLESDLSDSENDDESDKESVDSDEGREGGTNAMVEE